MTAIVYRFVGPFSRASNLGVSDFAVVTSLVGLVLSFAFVRAETGAVVARAR
jgi:hypothetical protein